MRKRFIIISLIVLLLTVMAIRAELSGDVYVIASDGTNFDGTYSGAYYAQLLVSGDIAANVSAGAPVSPPTGGGGGGSSTPFNETTTLAVAEIEGRRTRQAIVFAAIFLGFVLILGAQANKKWNITKKVGRRVDRLENQLIAFFRRRKK